MDSKNLIWLGSFFALLFITFCVTRHLDDLNPNISSMAYPKQELSSELETINLGNNTQDFLAAKLEVPKLEVPKLEVPVVVSQTPRRETTEVFSTQNMVKKVIKEKSPIIHNAKKVKKPKIIITKSKAIHESSKVGKPYIIGSMQLNSDAMKQIYNQKNSNELNKVAYMHSIHKGSMITITTQDLTAAASLKNYLHTQNVQKQHIKIITNDDGNNLIKILLTGRK